MNSRQENSMIFDQVSYDGDDYNMENQYLKLTAIDGVQGTYFQLDTKGGKWSFSEVEDVSNLIERFIKISEGLR